MSRAPISGRSVWRSSRSSSPTGRPSNILQVVERHANDSADLAAIRLWAQRCSTTGNLFRQTIVREKFAGDDSLAIEVTIEDVKYV